MCSVALTDGLLSIGQIFLPRFSRVSRELVSGGRPQQNTPVFVIAHTVCGSPALGRLATDIARRYWRRDMTFFQDAPNLRDPALGIGHRHRIQPQG
jgi:hypothetical protein